MASSNVRALIFPPIFVFHDCGSACGDRKMKGPYQSVATFRSCRMMTHISVLIVNINAAEEKGLEEALENCCGM